MIKYVAAYLGAGVAFAAIDAVWLTTMANRLYRPVIGPMVGRYSRSAMVVSHTASMAAKATPAPR